MIKTMRFITTVLLCFLLVFTMVSFWEDVAYADGGRNNEGKRIYGLNRQLTAIEVSKVGWNSSEVVFLAREDGYADALAAVPLAYAYDAPILLAAKNSISRATMAQIKNLRAQKVIILGGENAISPAVEKQLLSSLPSGTVIERIGGNNRYHTGQLIALALANKQGKATLQRGVLVYGGNFPDALSVASHAAVRGYPILLTESDRLPKETKDAIDALDIQHFYAIGGENVLSPSLVEKLGARRIKGENRFKTSFNLKEEFNPKGQRVYIATGLDFADAITGAVLAAKDNASILLVNGRDVEYSISKILKERDMEVRVLGGYNAVRYGIWDWEEPNQSKLEFIPRLKPFISYLQYANYNLINKIFVHPSWKPFPISGPLNWDENPYNSNSWQFYLHSLEHVGFLATGYEITGNEAFLAKGMEHILSWFEINGDIRRAKTRFAWHDHGTANRVQNMMHLWFYWKKSTLFDQNIENLFIDMIHRHGVFLADPKNYSPYNHGVFQDQALLQLSVIYDFFPESKMWQELALTRLMIRLKEDVSIEGVHKEHSPMYHLLMINRFNDIMSFCNYHDIKIPGTFIAYLKMMEDYLARITKPNGFLPLVGDTRQLEMFNRFRKRSVTSLLEYVQSGGQRGNPPLQRDAVYPEAGVALFRDGWGFDDQDLYIMFTAAFHSTIHKHGDDLSFILSRGETEFLVDGGMYNYVERDPMRQYLRGTLGHNTIAVDNQAYSLSHTQIGRSSIIDYGIFEEYSYVIGRHTLYPGVVIERTLIHYKPSTIIVHDRIVSQTNRKYSQIFRIGKDVETISTSCQVIELKSKLSDETLTIRQMLPVEGLNHYRGELNPHRGWKSTELNVAFPIDVFHFNIRDTKGEFLTLLTFGDSEFVKVEYNHGRYLLIDELGLGKDILINR